MKPPSILYIGLPANTKLMPKEGGPDREWLANALEEATTNLKVAGFDADNLWFEPDEISKLEDKLKEKNWDAVITGFGVRGQPALTPFFEQVVNTIREYDSNIKLGFNSTPTDTVEAARRLFPNIRPMDV